MTSGKSNNQLAKAAGYFSPIVLTILFLYIAFKGVDLKESFSLITRSSLFAIVIYIIIFFLSHFARAVRWKFMISSMKKNVSIFHLFGSVMVGYGVNCIIPRLGELYRGLFLGKWENISRTTVIGTIVVERIIDIASFAFAALISAGIYSGNLYNKIVWLKTSLVIGFTLIFALTVFLIFLVRYQEKFGNGFVKLAGKISQKYALSLRKIFDTLISGLSSIRGTKNIFTVAVWTVVVLLLYALNAYAGFYMLGMESTGKVTFATAWIVMTISSFGVLIPTPGGTGSYHIISIFALTQLFKFDYEISAAYAILTHFISYLFFILTTLILIYIVNKQRVKKGLRKESFFSVFKINPDEK
ncbi:MAG: lysylphosphatidylglycerol synthase transmembrane domain-containing protein [Bacteroidota bacterium]